MSNSAGRTPSVASSVFDPSDADWESTDGALTSDCPVNSEIRVADIIKKLPLVRPRIGTTESPVVCSSPRIRGRHAVADLLSRLIRDRYFEIEELGNRLPVSNFPKRGRIQSLLKFKLLRGATAVESNKKTRQRIRFSSGTLQKLDSDITASSESTSNQPTIGKHQEEIDSGQINGINSANNNQEKILVDELNRTVTSEGDDQQKGDEGHLEVKEITTMVEESSEEMSSSNVALPETSSVAVDVCYVNPRNMDTLSCNFWEEDMVDREIYGDDRDFFEPNLDWIHDISRPRSFWEGLRQAWYQEMLDNSANNDIRQLIERGSVSAVLASDFRDRMDQLMLSSAQLQMQPLESRENEHHHQSVVNFLRSQMHPLSCNPEKDLEGGSPIEHHYVQDSIQVEPVQNVVGDAGVDENEEIGGSYYSEHIESSHLPWSNYQEQEDIDETPPPLRRQSFATNNSYDHDSQTGSFIKNSSTIEMELICDLRAHMEQVYREMSELRKSVNSCMEMQSKFQGFIGNEVSAAVTDLNTEKPKEKQSDSKLPAKGSCCVCYEKKVDSLLYRCGHICACFKCAHKLQWSSGKCPICCAQIEDVVRVYTDY